MPNVTFGPWKKSHWPKMHQPNINGKFEKIAVCIRIRSNEINGQIAKYSANPKFG